MNQPQPELLECFETPNAERPFMIEHISEEFTSVCPMTGHPDFGHVELLYVPSDRCIELKSLKLYYQSFRQAGIFYEAVTNRIADDLVNEMAPQWLRLKTVWKGRGGIRSNITITTGQLPEGMVL